MLRALLAVAARRGLLLVLVSIVAHLLVHLAPGAPVEVDPTYRLMKPQDVARLRQAFHLDDPLPVQYVRFIGDLATGELRSFRDGRPVLETIGERFSNSLPLFASATLLAWTLAFPLGIRAARRASSAFDRSTTLIAYALISLPGFFLAYLVLVALSGRLGLPLLGTHSFQRTGDGGVAAFMDRIWHLAVPAGLSALGGIAILSRYVRAQMLEVAERPYVNAARARGIPEDAVIYRHALRNTLLPFITLFGFLLPNLIGGSVVFEQIFAWPGIGRLGYEALLARDFPVLLTLNFFAATLTLAGLTLTDWLYTLADPRLRTRA